MNKVIGLDVGHSAVKVAHASGRILFPTAVIPAFEIHDEVAAARARRDTFKVDGKNYFVGETAVLQGRMNSTPGLFENWVDTPEHSALLLAGYRRAVDAGAQEDALVVLGLPASLFARQRDKLREHASRLLGTQVMVMSQPFGPYSELMLDERGQLKSSHALETESWAVIEVGYFTTDFTMIQGGVWIEEKTTSCGGVRLATERLQRTLSIKGTQATLLECEDILRTRKMLSYGQYIDMSREVGDAMLPLAAEIMDTANRLFASDARRLNGIIITGGGSDLVFQHLKGQWPNAVQPKDPRFSVAEGMRRQGEYKLWVAAQEAQKSQPQGVM